ncbi:MAG TPA: UDP-2,3-diacylglucosamine diphosphatase [Xanthomonadaceae bacterium]|nr:UDP-2,3-diacylglucosamine diphosphatase [Xanthomonadaceae bacterium]
MTTLFISDLHLDPTRPAITDLFLRFLRDEARRAEALYILGDLFEAWVGDDDDSELAGSVASGLHALTDSGVAVAFLHGNRDFMLGEAYALRAGMRLLPEFERIELAGEPTLLLHGDQLCTGDQAYQQLRRQVRDPAWQQRMMQLPLDQRRAMAQQMRTASQEHQGAADESILDVHPDEVTATFVRFGVRRMIHGHTHRPAIHTLSANDQTCTRIVLGDWYEQGSLLRVERDSIDLIRLG